MKVYFGRRRQNDFMSKQEYFESVKCGLCGRDDYDIRVRPVNLQFDPQSVFSASGGIRGTQQIVRCRQCGLMYVNPRVKTSCVFEAYRAAVDELYVSQEEGRKQTFSRAFRLIERYMSGPGKILDIGAAGGFFLQVAKEKGWEPYGVEPSRWMAEWGNKRFKVNIKPGLLCEAAFPDNFFDVITMWDVLEHTPDPLAELVEARRILKDGGIIIINFPDIGSWPAILAGSKWWFLLSVHLYYFSVDTIASMLKKAGFSPLSFRQHWQQLNLEHLTKMVGLYSKPLSEAGLKVLRALKMDRWPVPYYAGQTNAIARKL